MSLIYGILWLSSLSLIGFIVLGFSIKIKSIIGILISIILIVPIILLCTANTIDELSISKKDVILDLKYLEIDLKNDFKIIANSVTGMPERIQMTKLKISKNDEKNIIQLIRNASNSKLVTSTNNAVVKSDFSDTIKNFEHNTFYSREILKTIDNYPTRLYLSIEEGSNILEYQRIED